jgi:hypothetical protein
VMISSVRSCTAYIMKEVSGHTEANTTSARPDTTEKH